MTSMQAINDLYACLSETIREEFSQQGKTENLPRGTKLVQPGIAPEYLTILNSGKAETSVDVRGQTVSLGVYGPGRVFGLHSIMSGELPHKTVTCLEQCEVTKLPKEVFENALARYPEIYLAVAKILSADLASADHVIRGHVRNCKTRSGRKTCGHA